MWIMYSSYNAVFQFQDSDGWSAIVARSKSNEPFSSYTAVCGKVSLSLSLSLPTHL